MSKQTLSIVGRIRKPHGVKGEIKLESFTDPVSKILDYSPLQLDDGSSIVINSCRESAKCLLVMINDIVCYEEAETLRNQFIYASLPSLDIEDGYYWKDLIGMNVMDPNSALLGIVDGLTTTHNSDLMIVKKGNKIIYVPFASPNIIERVDPNKKIIHIKWHEDDFND